MAMVSIYENFYKPLSLNYHCAVNSTVLKTQTRKVSCMALVQCNEIMSQFTASILLLTTLNSLYVEECGDMSR